MELNKIVNQKQIEALLSTAPCVQECVVRLRLDSAGVERAVVYLVQRGQQPLPRLQQTLDGVLAGDSITSACSLVALTSMPVTPDGDIDEAVLASLPVVDDELALNLTALLHDAGGPDQAAVVIADHGVSNPALHLSALLPDWAYSGAGAGVSREMSVAENAAPYLTIRTGVAALSEGGELLNTEATPRLLVDALASAARQYPDNGMVYVQTDGSEISQAYSELYKDAQVIASGLVGLGLAPGDRVIFQMELGQDFIPAFWGCVLGGFVPVPVTTAHQYSMNDAAVQKLARAWQMLHKPVVLASSRIRPELEALAAEAEFHGLSVFSISELRSGDTDAVAATALHRGNAADAAVILLTSGSTGVPKGVVLSHANLLAMALGTAQQNRFTSSDITLNWMPLEHVGAVSFLQTMAVVLGCKQVHAPTDYVLQNPLIWLELIEKHRASITWGPNFAFGLLNDLADQIARRSWDLSSMRFMVSAAEQIVAKTVRQFLRMLAPHGLASDSIHPAFGMSETCSGITWSQRFSLESSSDDIRYVELGAPIPSASIRIVDSANKILDEGETGRLQLKGPSVTAGYFENPERNSEVFTADGWFDTGDLGFLYHGRLTLTGREKEEIIINGINYSGAEIEAVVDEIAGVMSSFTAACGVQVAGDETDKLAIFFAPVSDDEAQLVPLLNLVRQQVAEKIGISPGFLIPLDAQDIPKTDIGKIQRARLRQSFKQHEFDSVIHRVDVLSENARTMPSWFYRKRWQRRNLAVPPVRKTGTVLLMVDQAGPGELICERLRAAGQRCIRVAAGTDYGSSGADNFVIQPENKDHYISLFNILKEYDEKIDQIVHCWTHRPYSGPASDTEIESAMRLGCHSLLLLVQALAQSQGEGSHVSLFVVSNHSQYIEQNDELAYEKTAVLGLLKSIPREMPWLQCQHLDTGVATESETADYVLAELEAGAAVNSRLEHEVAYRRGARLVSRLQRVELADKASDFPLRRGGTYLLTGGLGGIGRKVAQYLLQNLAVKLLLVGRSELTNEPDDERAAAFRSLQSLPGAVSYLAVDVRNLNKLETEVDQVVTNWQTTLDGVIHLAGGFHESSLEEETPAMFDTIVKAKMQALLALHQLLQKRESGVFIGFGSLSSFFGGTKLAAYAAANSCLTGFQHWQQEKTTIESYCFDWSMWEDLGVSRGFMARDAFHAAGYYILKPEQAINAFIAGLAHGYKHLMVGLDGGNENVRGYLDVPCKPRFGLVTYLQTESAKKFRAKLDSTVFSDSFGNTIDSRIIEREVLPLTADGEVDRNALATQNDLTAQSKVAPRTDLEKRIAFIWQDVLGIAAISIHDNFFAVGGDSLKGARIMNRLQEDTGVTMHVVALFNAPTVAELALHLEKNYTGSDGDVTGSVEQGVDQEKLRLMRSMITPLAPRSTAARSKNRRAVFVLSPPRSGSTLLRVMLGGNPQLFAPPELYLMPFDTMQQWQTAYSDQQSFWREGVIRALMEMQQVSAQQAEDVLQTLSTNGLSIPEFYQQIQDWLGQKILIDKTPTYALDINVLKRIEEDFDEVLYIHLLRHPYAVIHSFEEARLDQLLYAFMPSLHGKGETTFTRRQLAELTWLVCHQNIVEFLQTVPAQRKMQLKFESLVTQPRSSMEQVCAFMGVEFHDSMLRPYEDKAVRMTDGVHQESRMLGDMKFHTHKSIDGGVADSWRKAFTTDFLGEPSWQLADVFGYDSIEHHADVNKQAEHAMASANEDELLEMINGLSDEDVERALEEMLEQSGKGTQ